MRLEKPLPPGSTIGILGGVLALALALVTPGEAGQRQYEGVTLRVMLPDGFTEVVLIERGTRNCVEYFSSRCRTSGNP